MILLDHERIVQDKIYRKLNEMTTYIPLCLHCYLDDDYWTNASEKAKRQFYLKRTQLQGAKDYGQFIEADLLEWVEQNKELRFKVYSMWSNINSKPFKENQEKLITLTPNAYSHISLQDTFVPQHEKTIRNISKPFRKLNNNLIKVNEKYGLGLNLS